MESGGVGDVDAEVAIDMGVNDSDYVLQRLMQLWRYFAAVDSAALPTSGHHKAPVKRKPAADITYMTDVLLFSGANLL